MFVHSGPLQYNGASKGKQMSKICENCGKVTVVGKSGTHRRGVAGKRWKKRAQKTIRTFAPNLHVVTLVVDGQRRRMKLCTNCLKKFRKIQSQGIHA